MAFLPLLAIAKDLNGVSEEPKTKQGDRTGIYRQGSTLRTRDNGYVTTNPPSHHQHPR